MSRILVLGGGISGLAAAWRARSLAPNAEILILEKESELGGKVRTRRSQGFTVELGPDGFLGRKPAVPELSRELEISDRLRGPIERKTRSFVRRGRLLHPLPEGFSGLVPSDFDALRDSELLSEAGKLRAAEEPGIPALSGEEDESVAQFMTRRFGGELFQAVIEPLLAGIYAADAAGLSLKATFPRLKDFELELGSVTAGLRRERSASPPRTGVTQGPAFLTFEGGMGELPSALAHALETRGVRLLAGAEALSLERRGGAWRVVAADGSALAADAVILALPAAGASALVEGLHPDLAGALASIGFASTAVVSLGYRSEEVERGLDGYGYLVPAVEGSDILACTWTSSKWRGRAPDGRALLRLFVGRSGREALASASDGELCAAAREELRATLGIRAAPVFARVKRWPKAMPQYAPGHLRLLERIDEFLAEHRGLFLAGASYRGVGVPDCIESGYAAARAAVATVAAVGRGTAGG